MIALSQRIFTLQRSHYIFTTHLVLQKFWHGETGFAPSCFESGFGLMSEIRRGIKFFVSNNDAGRRAVVAHEFAHMKSEDSLLSVLILFSGMAVSFFLALTHGKFFLFLRGSFSSLQCSGSESSEYRADLLAAKHVDPNDLVSILNTVSAYVRRKGAFLDPVKRKGLGSLPKEIRERERVH